MTWAGDHQGNQLPVTWKGSMKQPHRVAQDRMPVLTVGKPVLGPVLSPGRQAFPTNPKAVFSSVHCGVRLLILVAALQPPCHYHLEQARRRAGKSSLSLRGWLGWLLDNAWGQSKRGAGENASVPLAVWPELSRHFRCGRGDNYVQGIHHLHS